MLTFFMDLNLYFGSSCYFGLLIVPFHLLPILFLFVNACTFLLVFSSVQLMFVFCFSNQSWHGLPLNCMLKNSSSPFILISSLQRSITLLALLLSFLLIHVSSQLMRTYTKYLKCIVFSFHFPLSLHQKYQKTETPQSNIYPLIHFSSIHKYICGRSLSGDLLTIIISF